jgi:predicted RNA-binding protein YlqC (UPF0109 family)
MEELIKAIALSLVDYPDEVIVSSSVRDGETTIELKVAASDMGKVIGKQGRIAKAIRVVAKAAAAKDNKIVNVEIVQ